VLEALKVRGHCLQTWTARGSVARSTVGYRAHSGEESVGRGALITAAAYAHGRLPPPPSAQLCTYAGQTLNNYMMYMGGQGLYTSTIVYTRACG
jgi:hypothetical protein